MLPVAESEEFFCFDLDLQRPDVRGSNSARVRHDWIVMGDEWLVRSSSGPHPSFRRNHRVMRRLFAESIGEEEERRGAAGIPSSVADRTEERKDAASR